MISQNLVIEQMKEFHADPGMICSLWWYKTPAEAEADGDRKFDWKQNPLAALPQFVGFSVRKR
jgi:hypothetical protein